MKVEIKNGLNPILYIAYTPVDWIIKDLKMFDTEDKYIIYHTVFDKSIELNKDKFETYLNGDIFQIIKETDSSRLAKDIATEIGVAPHIYLLTRSNKYIAKAINLYTFENDKERVNKLNDKIYSVRLTGSLNNNAELKRLFTIMIISILYIMYITLRFIL